MSSTVANDDTGFDMLVHHLEATRKHHSRFTKHHMNHFQHKAAAAAEEEEKIPTQRRRSLVPAAIPVTSAAAAAAAAAAASRAAVQPIPTNLSSFVTLPPAPPVDMTAYKSALFACLCPWDQTSVAISSHRHGVPLRLMTEATEKELLLAVGSAFGVSSTFHHKAVADLRGFARSPALQARLFKKELRRQLVEVEQTADFDSPDDSNSFLLLQADQLDRELLAVSKLCLQADSEARSFLGLFKCCLPTPSDEYFFQPQIPQSPLLDDHQDREDSMRKKTFHCNHGGIYALGELVRALGDHPKRERVLTQFCKVYHLGDVSLGLFELQLALHRAVTDNENQLLPALQRVLHLQHASVFPWRKGETRLFRDTLLPLLHSVVTHLFCLPSVDTELVSLLRDEFDAGVPLDEAASNYWMSLCADNDFLSAVKKAVIVLRPLKLLDKKIVFDECCRHVRAEDMHSFALVSECTALVGAVVQPQNIQAIAQKWLQLEFEKLQQEPLPPPPLPSFESFQKHWAERIGYFSCLSPTPKQKKKLEHLVHVSSLALFHTRLERLKVQLEDKEEEELDAVALIDGMCRDSADLRRMLQLAGYPSDTTVTVMDEVAARIVHSIHRLDVVNEEALEGWAHCALYDTMLQKMKKRGKEEEEEEEEEEEKVTIWWSASTGETLHTHHSQQKTQEESKKKSFFGSLFHKKKK